MTMPSFTKRELLELTRDRDKLERALGGIKEMGGLPDVLFVIDTNKEAIAVSEANVLKIPVVAILDSNSSPDGIAYPIPGNDDAMRAIHLYCELVSGSVLDGLQAELTASGIDVGGRAELPEAALPEEEAALAEGAGQFAPAVEEGAAGRRRGGGRGCDGRPRRGRRRGQFRDRFRCPQRAVPGFCPHRRRAGGCRQRRCRGAEGDALSGHRPHRRRGADRAGRSD